ncbi:Hypothetical predicted protein [Olea europaea subsp. europaea]|uniref:Uncharacterized protein n=1 Tax=Olea europaea subsp. europaea TaxID=158383 RepID=A0A8S0S5U2_OLEEU|nr:Hypothetical predicted protein [Olea europaea subsp. europaea]
MVKHDVFIRFCDCIDIKYDGCNIKYGQSARVADQWDKVGVVIVGVLNKTGIEEQVGVTTKTIIEEEAVFIDPLAYVFSRGQKHMSPLTC